MVNEGYIEFFTPKTPIILTGFNHQKKIQAIKSIRTVTRVGLAEAKGWLDAVQDGGKVQILVNTEELERARAELHYGLVEFTVMGDGEDEDELTPMPIQELALTLAMWRLAPKQVEVLADALAGIEDARGSLREASKLMRKARELGEGI